MAADDILQSDRLLQIESPAGKDVLLPLSATVDEEISRLFTIDLELCAARGKAAQVNPEQLIGRPITLRVSLGDNLKGPYRYFHGIVNRFQIGGRDHRLAYFQAQLVPWMWLLTRTSDCKVYQDKKVPEIILEIFQELQQQFPFVKFDNRTQSGNYTSLDYCVQYRETDFNFVSRLMEQNGIYYFYKHASDGHTLILADDSTQVKEDCPEKHEFQYFPEGGPGERNFDSIMEWQSVRTLWSGKYTLQDHHFELPAKPLAATSTTQHEHGGNQSLELFDYPGEHADPFNKPDQRLDQVEPEGEKLANRRMEEEESSTLEIQGVSNGRCFATGHLFDLTKHFDSGQNGTHLLTKVRHTMTQFPHYYTEGTSESAVNFYQNSFVCQRKEHKYAAPRLTAKPVIDGVQSALVVGKEGEEIWIDKFGRVRVQFFWDRYGKKNETSTCWVRVAQVSAGKRWGAFFWPRIGQEVVVGFLEGDPDQPIILGSVYNADQMPPYTGDGPDGEHKHDPNVSGIKTNSTKGGDGYNELRFDDTQDKEQVFLHGQKDLDVRILNDARHFVGRHEHRTIGIDEDGKKSGNRVVKIAQDDHLHVLQHRVEHYEGNYNQRVGYGGGGQSGGNRNIDVDEKELKKVGKSQHLTVVQDRFESIGLNSHLNVGGLHQVKAGQLLALESGTMVHIKAGVNMILEAGVQLSLRVGANFIDIQQSGIWINGNPLQLNSGGAPGVGPGANPIPPFPPVEGSPSTPNDADDSKTGLKSAP